MNNNELFEQILKSRKMIVAYYPYPTGGYGEENTIIQTDNFNGKKYNEPLRNIVALMIKLGAVGVDYSSDNKTAVEVEVQGLEFPVFFIQFDNKYYISKKVKSNAERIELKRFITLFN